MTDPTTLPGIDPQPAAPAAPPADPAPVPATVSVPVAFAEQGAIIAARIAVPHSTIDVRLQHGAQRLYRATVSATDALALFARSQAIDPATVVVWKYRQDGAWCADLTLLDAAVRTEAIQAKLAEL